jgi:hypothetical protein
MLRISIDYINANATPTRKSIDYRSECLRGSTGATNHSTQVFWMHVHLKNITALCLFARNLDFVWMIDDTFHEMFESSVEQGLSL